MSNKLTNSWSTILVLIFLCVIIAIFAYRRNGDPLKRDYVYNDTINTQLSIVLPDSVQEIYYFINSNYNDVDTIMLSSGRARVSVTAPSYSFVNIVDSNDLLSVFMADGSDVSIDLINDTWHGSLLNNKFLSMRNESRVKFEDPLNDLYSQYFNLPEDSVSARTAIEQRADSIDKLYSEYVLQFSKDNFNNPIPAYVISNVFYSYSYDQLSHLLDSSAVYAEHPILDYAKSHLAGLYKRRNGIKFTELNMVDTKGDSVSLSQWVGNGKYVFVDFWASWCSPCRGELPNILEVYDKYHKSEGFDVVGVSVDQSLDSWVKCIEKFNLPWHHMSELNGRGGQTKSLYGVGAIPCSILLNPDGIIVASDLRGDALMETLKKVYGY